MLTWAVPLPGCLASADILSHWNQRGTEKLHANWPSDRDYMAPPTRGKLVALDPALLVTPPPGLEVGYVPIVTGQAAKE